MKQWFNSLSKDKIQKLLFFGILVLVFGVFLISLKWLTPEEETPGNVDPPNGEQTPPGSQDGQTPDNEIFKAPCDAETYQIVRKFYSVELDTLSQEMAVIQFGSKYFLSRGISVSLDSQENFNVIASLSGIVKEVTDSAIYGKTVVLDHGDELISEYIGLSEVNVNVGDNISQGNIIGVSGTSEYDATALNHVHFKISKNGTYYDPEKLIGRSTNEIVVE